MAGNVNVTSPPEAAHADDASYSYVGEKISLEVRVVFIIIGCLYTVIGVVGNLLIIATILITRTMRNPHYYFIINLALSDLVITGYVLPIITASLVLGYYPVVDFSHCIFNGFIIVCSCVSSLLSLMVISINRYLCVCHSQMFSSIFSSNKILSSVFGCIAIWMLAGLSTMPSLFGWGRFTYDAKTHYCGYDRTFNYSYTLFLMLFSIGTPVAVVFACNFLMWRYVRESSHRIYAMTHASNSSSSSSGGRSNSGTSNSGGSNSGGSNSGSNDSGSCSHHQTPGGEMTSQYGQKMTSSELGANKTGHHDAVISKSPRSVNSGGGCSGSGSGGRDDSKTTGVDHQTNSGKLKKQAQRNVKKYLEPEKGSGVLVTPDELALIKTIFIIFASFAALMSPYMVSALVDTEDRWPAAVHLTCSFTSFTNSCVNCLLYGLMTPAFKKAFRGLFERCCGMRITG